MVIQPAVVKELKISPVASRMMVLADGRKFEAPLVVLYVRALDSESITLTAVADTPDPLLGISTMEDLGIAIDPTTGEATKVRATGLMLMSSNDSRWL